MLGLLVDISRFEVRASRPGAIRLVKEEDGDEEVEEEEDEEVEVEEEKEELDSSEVCKVTGEVRTSEATPALEGTEGRGGRSRPPLRV